MQLKLFDKNHLLWGKYELVLLLILRKNNISLSNSILFTIFWSWSWDNICCLECLAAVSINIRKAKKNLIWWCQRLSTCLTISISIYVAQKQTKSWNMMSEIIDPPVCFYQHSCCMKAIFYWYRMVKIIDPPGCFHHINIHVAWKQFLATLVALH